MFEAVDININYIIEEANLTTSINNLITNMNILKEQQTLINSHINSHINAPRYASQITQVGGKPTKHIKNNKSRFKKTRKTASKKIRKSIYSRKSKKYNHI